MGRQVVFKNDNVTFIYGNDHAVGEFLQITDKRFAGTKEDYQGEGYVLDWDSLFGFTINNIGATKEDIAHDNNPDHLLAMVDKFAETIKV